MENEHQEIAELLRESLTEGDYTPLAKQDIQGVRDLLKDREKQQK